MRVLITGMSGFIGSHLARRLVDAGHDVWGTYFVKKELAALEPVRGRSTAVFCDIRERAQVARILRRARPERIYHLAAQSLPTVSWKRPALTIDTNVVGTVNLFEAVKSSGLRPRVVVAGSSASYGLVTPDEVPVGEDHSLRPLHPYGVSKAAQEMLAYQYWRNDGLWANTARIFNTTGPGKVHDVCSDFASQVASIERGRLPNPMRVGNLSPKRDITDVRDQVVGLESLSEKGEPGTAYNLCSSRAVAIREVLDRLVGMAGRRVRVVVDKKLLRPTDEPIILGDNSLVARATGWRPAIPLEKTLRDTLDYWRASCRG